jgi:hypothetical protein
MSSYNFLENPNNPSRVAAIAILFQSTVSSFISTLLLFTLITGVWISLLIKILLILDCLFICCHLLYRFLYRGPKVKLSSRQKQILAGHVVMSLLALVTTALLAAEVIFSSRLIVVMAILMWVSSLTLGVWFSNSKYSK